MRRAEPIPISLYKSLVLASVSLTFFSISYYRTPLVPPLATTTTHSFNNLCTLAIPHYHPAQPCFRRPRLNCKTKKRLEARMRSVQLVFSPPACNATIHTPSIHLPTTVVCSPLFLAQPQTVRLPCPSYARTVLP